MSDPDWTAYDAIHQALWVARRKRNSKYYDREEEKRAEALGLTLEEHRAKQKEEIEKLLPSDPKDKSWDTPSTTN